jgi:aarF domain-containing kinase
MECLEGVKLVDGIRSRYKVVAEKMGKTLEQLETEQIALMKSGKFLFKSIEQSKQEQNKIQWYYAMHDYLFNINNLWKTCYNFSLLRLIYGPMEIERTQLPVDLGSLLEVLCNVHADELFSHGAFNGDPHPVSSMLYPHAQQHILFIHLLYTVYTCKYAGMV